MTTAATVRRRLPLALGLAGGCALAQAGERALVYPAIQGTRTPDRSATPYVIEGDQVYKAIPGTRTPDRSGESWTIREGEIRPNIPGTRTPDRSATPYVIEDD